MKKSFSLIELIIVLVVIGILYSTINFNLKDSNLNQAADQLISHINYTRHLAIIDNKMQYYPITHNTQDNNRSKYWFKSWWQLRIGVKTNQEYFYEVFSDSSSHTDSTNFDKAGSLIREFARDPINGKYLDGNYGNDINKQLNLTSTYGIQLIKLNNIDFKKGSIRIIFDNKGNIYIDEGKRGDANDINPYELRIPLLNIRKITLCQTNKCDNNISICISPKIGNTYICK